MLNKNFYSNTGVQEKIVRRLFLVNYSKFTWRFVSKANQQEDGARIDLLFNRIARAITLWEIKYSDKPFPIDKSYAQEISKKIEAFKKQTKTKKQLFFL